MPLATIFESEHHSAEHCLSMNSCSDRPASSYFIALLSRAEEVLRSRSGSHPREIQHVMHAFFPTKPLVSKVQLLQS